MRRAVVSVILALAVLAAGCSDDQPDTSSPPAEPVGSSSGAATPTTNRASTTSSVDSTSTTTAACVPSGAAATRRNGPEPSSTMLLSDVSVDPGPACTDLVTFTFLRSPDEPPGYTVEYQPGPFARGGSGEPVAVDGEAFLVVRFFPAATADLAQDGAPMTYTGPDTIVPEPSQHVRQLRLVDAFEGYVTWVIGLDAEVGFEVTASVAPPTLQLAIG